MAVSYDIDPTTALIRALDRVQLTCSNWGNVGGQADPTSLSTGSQAYSLSGLVVAPDSDLDQVHFTSVTKYSGNQWVTVGAPYIGDIPGAWKAGTVQQQLYPGSFTQIGTGVSHVFGPDMNTAVPGSLIWGGNLSQGIGGIQNYPSLKLIAYLRPPSIIPLTRLPLLDYANSERVWQLTDPVYRAYCVAGRKRLHAVFRCSTTVGVSSYDVQLTGLLGGQAQNFEFPLTTAQTLNASAGPPAAQDTIEIKIDNLDTYWLIIRLSNNVGFASATYKIWAQ